MMQPSEFIKSLEQKVRIKPHCTAHMRNFVAAVKDGKFDVPVEKLTEMDKAAKLPSSAEIEAARETLAQVVASQEHPPEAAKKATKIVVPKKAVAKARVEGA